MEETTKWRAAEYPIKTDDKIMNMLVRVILNRTQVPFISVGEIVNIDQSSSLILANSTQNK